MSKDYTGEALDNIILRIVIPAQDLGDGDPDQPPKYHAGRLDCTATILNGDDKPLKPIQDISYLGTAKSVPWTEPELYQYYNNLCSPLATKLKNLYLDGINVDPST